jgi:cyclophilin family peptidyl-prolyl cis-trans isomerase
VPKRLLVIALTALLTSGCAVSVTGKPVVGPPPVATSGNPETSATTSGDAKAAVRCAFTDDASPGALPVDGRPAAASDGDGHGDGGTLTLTTDQGALKIELDPAAGPCSVRSVRFLARKKFYDGTSCHRLTTNPNLGVLQCGDPSGTGTGTPGYRYEDKLPAKGAYRRGVVAMANAGPGTNGSQFFIVHGAAQIPADYPVLGRVVAGMEIVDKVVSGGVAGGADDGRPATPLKFTAVTGG